MPKELSFSFINSGGMTRTGQLKVRQYMKTAEISIQTFEKCLGKLDVMENKEN